VRRRLIPLVIVGTVVVITLAAGASIWVLARQSARTTAINEVLSSAQEFGEQGGGTLPVGSITVRNLSSATAKRRLKLESGLIKRLIGASARVDNAKFFNVTDGSVSPEAIGNSPVPLKVLDAVAASGSIGASTARSGSTGSVAWAVEAVAFQLTAHIGLTGRTRVYSSYKVLALTRAIGRTSYSSDFVIVALAVILFAIVVSVALSRRITGPLRRAVATTERIAAGDLDARVGARPRDIPELSSLAKSIDAMAESLGRLRSAERQFLLSVSHELRTPLTSIRGYSEAILDGTATDPTQAAGVIGNEARRLERLVGDLLDLAKLDARTFSFHFRTVNVAEVLEEVAEELRPVVDAAGLTLGIHPPDAPVFARVDPDRLDQVLANLVENAAKYARTTILLGGIARGPEARVLVEDDGPGIPLEEIGRIFERHYSADRHARPGRPRGSGLGLAIAAELSGAMGARVTVESPVGPAGGTRMVVVLPTVSSFPTQT
jgi:signal transduction histidine kinase